MARQPRMTSTQAVLYTTLVPFAAVGFTLLALSILRTGSDSPSKPTETGRAAPAAGTPDDSRTELRRQFRECMQSAGADLSRPRFRSRFSPPPDLKKIREAASVCQSLLGSGGVPPPTSGRGPSTLPVA